MRLPALPMLMLLVLPRCGDVHGQQEAARGEPPSAEQQDGWKTLFNGRDLSGWKGLEGRWSVEDGAITGRNTADDPLDHNTFLVWQGGEPADFELRFEFRIRGGNSGVQYRSRVLDEQRFIVTGYQADIDSGTRFTGMNY